MSKIRINELARQLEVKSREVIDKLHELGIAEKVTHSSSIDEDKADQLRRYYSGESHAPLPAATRRNGSSAAVVEESEEQTHEAPKEESQPAPRRVRVPQAPPPEVVAVPEVVVEAKAEPTPEASPAVAEKSDDDNR